MADNAYIVSAVRTPGGKKNGSLSQWHPADMGAIVIDELVKKTGIDPKDIDDVIFGCVDQVGAQSGNVARNAILASSLPESVPGTSVDRQCGSSQQALSLCCTGCYVWNAGCCNRRRCRSYVYGSNWSKC